MRTCDVFNLTTPPSGPLVCQNAFRYFPFNFYIIFVFTILGSFFWQMPSESKGTVDYNTESEVDDEVSDDFEVLC